MFILRVGRENVETATTSLAMMTSLGDTGTKCRVRILHVGGTLDKVETKYKQLSEAWLESCQKKLETQYKGVQGASG